MVLVKERKTKIIDEFKVHAALVHWNGLRNMAAWQFLVTTSDLQMA